MLFLIVFLAVTAGFLFFYYTFNRRLANFEPRTGTFDPVLVQASWEEFKQELETTADEIIKRLEGRVTSLERLLAEADAKIAALEHLVKGEAPARPAEHAVFAGCLELMPEMSDEIMPGEPLAAEKPGESAAPPAHSREVSPEPQVGVSPKYAVVFSMAEQGYDAAGIARATGMGQGEVSLLLQLHKRHVACENND